MGEATVFIKSFSSPRETRKSHSEFYIKLLQELTGM